MYNNGIYPKDAEAKKGIDKAVELHHLTEDNEYLVKVEVCVLKFIKFIQLSGALLFLVSRHFVLHACQAGCIPQHIYRIVLLLISHYYYDYYRRAPRS